MDKSSISKLRISFAPVLTNRLPGSPRLWPFLTLLVYLAASLSPAILRGAETMAGYQCLLYGPLSLAVNAPLVFMLWCLNFEILFSLIEVLSPYPIRSQRRTRISLVAGLILFSGMTLMIDPATGRGIELQPKLGAVLWYFSMILVYVARVKKQNLPVAARVLTPEELNHSAAGSSEFLPDFSR